MEEIYNFITAEECQELIKMIDANHHRSSVVVGGTDRTDVTDHRTSSTSNLDMNNPVVKSIQQKIAEHLGLDIIKGEALQGQLYEPGQYFKPHNDFFSGAAYDMHCKSSGNRTHTLMIYLNDDFKGGGTHFPNLNKTVVPQTGKALWWYNTKDGELQYDYLHEGVTVDEGKKYIVTSWWRENNWDGAGDEKLYYESQKENTVQKVEEPVETQIVEGMQNKSYIVKASQAEELKEPVVKKEFTSVEDFPRFTENGFALIKCPEQTWNIIKDSYELLKDKKQTEEFAGKEEFIVGGDSELMSFDHLPSVRKLIHEQLLSTHEEWVGESLTPSFIYGIRSYLRGATLTPHVDKIATHHVSSIIIVDKDLACGCSHKPNADDWPLDIQGHDGEWYKVYAQPGDMILYESAVCEHGRKETFGGTYFRNFYVHYSLKDWIYKK
jgi:prolyl 4-hydroxylase